MKRPSWCDVCDRNSTHASTVWVQARVLQDHFIKAGGTRCAIHTGPVKQQQNGQFLSVAFYNVGMNVPGLTGGTLWVSPVRFLKNTTSFLLIEASLEQPGVDPQLRLSRQTLVVPGM